MFQNVVVIAGVARSGTSWLGEIVNSSPDVEYRFQPLFSYAFKDRVGIDSSRDEYESFLRELYLSRDPFLMQSDKRESGIYPTFAKSRKPRILALKEARYHYLHIRFLTHFPNLRLLPIVRHPGAVLASWMANPKEFPAGSDPLAEWRLGGCKNQGRSENFFGFYKWREAANIFLDLQDQFPDRVKIVHYESLVEDAMGISEELFAFSGIPFGEQTRRFLEDCNSRDSDSPYSVYKSKEVKNRWRSELDPRIAGDIEQELAGTRLERFLA